MGEWSEYFEDFPEEHPDNYGNAGFCSGKGVAQIFNSETPEDDAKGLARFLEEVAKELADEEKEEREEEEQNILVRQPFYNSGCIHCGSSKLSVYIVSDDLCLCQCKQCNSSYKKQISERI